MTNGLLFKLERVLIYHLIIIPEILKWVIVLLVHICTLRSSWHILRNQQVLNLQLKGYVTLRHFGGDQASS